MYNCRETKNAVDTASARSGLLAGVEEHFKGCSDCRQYADSTFMLMGMLSGQPRVEAPPDFDFHLRARLARARDENRGWRWSLAEFWSRSFSWKEAAAALAVVVAVASSSTFYLSRSGATNEQLTAKASPSPVVAGPDATPFLKETTAPAVDSTAGNSIDTARNSPAAMAQPGRRQVNPALVRVVSTGARTSAGNSFDLAGTQEILVYQPGRAGRPGASRSVVIPRRGQVAFGAQLATASLRPGTSQTVETF